MNYKDDAISFLSDATKEMTVLFDDLNAVSSFGAQEAITNRLDDLLTDVSYAYHKLTKHLKED